MKDNPKVTKVEGWDMALNEVARRRFETAILKVIPNTGRIGIHFPESGDYVDPLVPYPSPFLELRAWIRQKMKELRLAQSSWDEERI